MKTGNELWFLEVTWDDSPMGLVLVENPDGTFRRVGIFKMGRNEPMEDEDPDFPMAIFPLGPRNWDWEEGLKMCTITLV